MREDEKHYSFGASAEGAQLGKQQSGRSRVDDALLCKRLYQWAKGLKIAPQTKQINKLYGPVTGAGGQFPSSLVSRHRVSI